MNDPAMKKILAASVLSLAILGLTTTEASAWFRCCGHCCPHCYSYSICCRPYNAFTPVCFGNLYCDGCCMPPNGMWQSAAGCANSLACFNGGMGCECSYGGQLPAGDVIEKGTPPLPFTPPTPTPVGQAQPIPYNGAAPPWAAAMSTGMVQPAAYGQAYYPNYYNGYYPQMGGMPNYGYGPNAGW
jgi:hypothetical protein